MRDDVDHDLCPIPRQKNQNGVQASGNDHQCRRFDAYGDNVGVGRSMFHSKGVSDVSSMVNESENDQRCEKDIYESGEWNEHYEGGVELVYIRHFFDHCHDTACSIFLWAVLMEIKNEIGNALPKEANEISERTTVIPTLGPPETCWYKMRQRHVCNCIVNLCSWKIIRMLTMNPSAPHVVTIVGNPVERCKERLTRFEVRLPISVEMEPNSFQVLLRSMTII